MNRDVEARGFFSIHIGFSMWNSSPWSPWYQKCYCVYDAVAEYLSDTASKQRRICVSIALCWSLSISVFLGVHYSVAVLQYTKESDNQLWVQQCENKTNGRKTKKKNDNMHAWPTCVNSTKMKLLSAQSAYVECIFNTMNYGAECL